MTGCNIKWDGMGAGNGKRKRGKKNEDTDEGRKEIPEMNYLQLLLGRR